MLTTEQLQALQNYFIERAKSDGLVHLVGLFSEMRELTNIDEHEKNSLLKGLINDIKDNLDKYIKADYELYDLQRRFSATDIPRFDLDRLKLILIANYPTHAKNAQFKETIDSLYPPSKPRPILLRSALDILQQDTYSTVTTMDIAQQDIKQPVYYNEIKRIKSLITANQGNWQLAIGIIRWW